MEQSDGKLRKIKGVLSVNGKQIEYEEYKDSNRPANLRTIVFKIPGHEPILSELDTEQDVLQKVAENIFKKYNLIDPVNETGSSQDTVVEIK